MSASAASIQCPVCYHTGVFDSAECLRNRLIFVSTNSIACPVCQEEINGLDKLTIHLFTHVNLISSSGRDVKRETVSPVQQPKQNDVNTYKKTKQPSITVKNSQNTTAVGSVKYVKIYPKLPVVPSTTSNCSTNASLSSNEYINSPVKEITAISSNTICNVCGLQFVDSHILKMHKCLIHNIEEVSEQSSTRYDCHLCPKNFKMRGSLMVHMRVAHYGFLNTQPADIKMNSENLEGNEKSTILVRNDNKQWQCEVCNKCFTTKYFLKKHKRLHTGETPYACTQCNKTFTFQQSYHKHLLYHNDEKPHICSYCNRAFKELSTLHNHQRIHTGEKPFSCETCGKCFRQRVSYLVHKRIHTGVLPYKCTACDKSFRYKVSQRTHKCQAQPPGAVIRQSCDLVEKLKKKHKTPQMQSAESATNSLDTNIPNCKEICPANIELARRGAELSLEDNANENFKLLPEYVDDNRFSNAASNEFSSYIEGEKEMTSSFNDFVDLPTEEKSVPSPSDIFKKMCLSPPDDNGSGQHNNDINFDILNELFKEIS